ncbi:MAG: hypothetical protein CVT79_05345 [Alphaproteobacteria bacterium HGW-Alphaproteobacteria-18]|nr:MAG: hypothetical protein CVT79_05345 [Alphaproteobacteria bacterium HGW-Alphaproteobacteria-18]
MVRYFTIFAIILGLGLVVMAGILAQNGYSLFAPEMRMMLLVCVLVAAYVSWRISTVLKRRKEDAADLESRGQPSARKGRLGGLLGGKSKAHMEREARVAARRRKLIAEGKLEPEEADMAEPAPLPTSEEEAPTRVSSSASVKEKMAARAERVRRAREEGKI